MEDDTETYKYIQNRRLKSSESKLCINIQNSSFNSEDDTSHNRGRKSLHFLQEIFSDDIIYFPDKAEKKVHKRWKVVNVPSLDKAKDCDQKNISRKTGKNPFEEQQSLCNILLNHDSDQSVLSFKIVLKNNALEIKQPEKYTKPYYYNYEKPSNKRKLERKKEFYEADQQEKYTKHNYNDYENPLERKKSTIFCRKNKFDEPDPNSKKLRQIYMSGLDLDNDNSLTEMFKESYCENEENINNKYLKQTCYKVYRQKNSKKKKKKKKKGQESDLDEADPTTNLENQENKDGEIKDAENKKDDELGLDLINDYIEDQLNKVSQGSRSSRIKDNIEDRASKMQVYEKEEEFLLKEESIKSIQNCTCMPNNNCPQKKPSNCFCPRDHHCQTINGSQQATKACPCPASRECVAEEKKCCESRGCQYEEKRQTQSIQYDQPKHEFSQTAPVYSYPGQGNGYPRQVYGYPGQGIDSPEQGNRYLGQGSGYRGQGSSYPGQGNGYPGQGNGYPGQGSGYPGQGNGYPGQGNSYPGQGNGYPGQGSGYPGQGNGFPGQGNNFPGQGRGRCTCPPVGSPPVGGSPVGGPPVGIPPVGGPPVEGPHCRCPPPQPQCRCPKESLCPCPK